MRAESLLRTDTGQSRGQDQGPLVVSCGTQQGQPASSPGADGRVKAARRAPEGLGLDATVRRATLAKGLSAKAFLAGNPDGRGRLAPFWKLIY